MITSIEDVETLAYASFMKLYPNIPRGLDKDVRKPEWTRYLLDTLKIDDAHMKNIKVTGSKGKGSLSILLARLLVSQGLKVGLFTSPHLQSFKERIRINGQAVDDESILEMAGDWAKAVGDIEEQLEENTYLGPVGASAALAMSIYQKEQTDYNVVELGRGARYDDVNQIKGRVALINTVFLEHHELGETIEDVAYNKAGVIKRGMDFAISAIQSHEVEEILRKEATLNEVDFYMLGKDFSVANVTISLENTTFDYLENGEVVYEGIRLGLLGDYQANNAAMAIFCARKMGVLGLGDDEPWLDDLSVLRWSGRLEVIDEAPFALLDGCISGKCMPSVLALFSLVDKKPIVGVVGIPSEKDYMGVVRELSRVADHLIMTHASNDYLKFSIDQLAKAREINEEIFYEPQVVNACERAKELAGIDGKILYVGTQSMIKDVKIHYGQSTLNVF